MFSNPNDEKTEAIEEKTFKSEQRKNWLRRINAENLRKNYVNRRIPVRKMRIANSEKDV